MDACTAFESAFNLTWNDTAEMYFVSDSLRSQLPASNPTVTFTIAAATSGPAVSIEMPYSISLGLNASFPLSDPLSSTLPLKRAENSTQYTLGRAFLQSAYVIANYEYFNFSVSQALYPSSSTSPQLVTLSAKGTSSTSSAISPGVIVDIVVAAVAVLAIIAMAIFIIL
jgi:hypothetical protein